MICIRNLMNDVNIGFAAARTDLIKNMMKYCACTMMTSSNGNILRVIGPLCWAFTGPRRIPLTEASDTELWCSLWSAPGINGWVNTGEAGDLRRHHAHYDVTVMKGFPFMHLFICACIRTGIIVLCFRWEDHHVLILYVMISISSCSYNTIRMADKK